MRVNAGRSEEVKVKVNPITGVATTTGPTKKKTGPRRAPPSVTTPDQIIMPQSYTISLCGSAPEDPFISRLRGIPAFSIMTHLRCDMQCPPVFTDPSGAFVSREIIENLLDPSRPARLKADLHRALVDLPDGTVTLFVRYRDMEAIKTYCRLPAELQPKFSLVFVTPDTPIPTPQLMNEPAEYSPEAMNLLIQGLPLRSKKAIKARVLAAAPPIPLFEVVVVLPTDAYVMEQYESVHEAWQQRVVLKPFYQPLRMRTPAITRCPDVGLNMNLSLDEFFSLPDPASFSPPVYVPFEALEHLPPVSKPKPIRKPVPKSAPKSSPETVPVEPEPKTKTKPKPKTKLKLNPSPRKDEDEGLGDMIPTTKRKNEGSPAAKKRTITKQQSRSLTSPVLPPTPTPSPPATPGPTSPKKSKVKKPRKTKATIEKDFIDNLPTLA
jgi:hypothetical protein